MVDYIRIRNWEKFQHYKDRSPPWIKLHRSILRDYEFSRLSDASKLLAFCLMPIAAEQNNRIPCDVEWLKRETGIKGKIQLEPLQAIGFIDVEHNASDSLLGRKQDAMPETEKRRDREETEKRRGDGASRRCPPDWSPNRELILQMAEECPNVDQDFELAQIRDTEFPKPRKDWNAVYRKWMRKEQKKAQQDGKPNRFDQIQANLARQTGH